MPSKQLYAGECRLRFSKIKELLCSLCNFSIRVFVLAHLNQGLLNVVLVDQWFSLAVFYRVRQSLSHVVG